MLHWVSARRSFNLLCLIFSDKNGTFVAMNRISAWTHLLRSGTFIGLIFGFVTVLGSFLLEGGSFDALFALAPIAVVVGGTISTAIIGTSLDQVAKIPRLVGIALLPASYDPAEIINQIVRIAVLARREGIIAIERHLPEVKHPFMRKIFQVAIDGADPEALRSVAETEMDIISERHRANIQLFTKMGGYSPTMGIIGTVMGLINTLGSAGQEPEVLIRHIASAFIATMWGIFLANLVLLPIGDKLQTLHDDEEMLLRLISDGVAGVQLGETPSVIRARLASALPREKQEQLLAQPLPRALAGT